ncbi:unnamed protein product [Rotaria socialis]|uniref:Uncharacterized protein n=1 Tax=Rotaria socialis TaxID=392032 RepID=A0A821PIV3_9BILA|nr:unnamed protein product [Rotaria socialis]CAF3438896.1 unnamed protein product [Rotaria socialis]CAF4641357.1 unnamed protein product [Rotaria socialis]CAF4808484.1 unnamed protein product [Rotaria socialis]
MAKFLTKFTNWRTSTSNSPIGENYNWRNDELAIRYYPSHVQRKAQQTYSLQMTIYLAFNQWLDKRMTRANWGCELEPTLYTITIPQEYIKNKNQIIENEEEYRKLMIIYALNDCLAVTKLIPNIYDDKQLINYEQDLVPGDLFLSDEINHDVEIHVQREVSELNDDHIHIEPIHNALIGVHVKDGPYEMISDDDLNDISLPEIMKLHLPHKPRYSNENETYHEASFNYNDNEVVHEQDEPSNQIEIISDDDIQPNIVTNHHKKKNQLFTRNQRKNRRKRAKRYRFEIIRQVYNKFSISNIKKVLIFMNIHYVNINVVGLVLFLGVKNEQIKQEVDKALHSELFTKSHYYHIRKKLHLDK